jgi:hypothetical protein
VGLEGADRSTTAGEASTGATEHRRSKRLRRFMMWQKRFTFLLQAGNHRFPQ